MTSISVNIDDFDAKLLGVCMLETDLVNGLEQYALTYNGLPFDIVVNNLEDFKYQEVGSVIFYMQLRKGVEQSQKIINVVHSMEDLIKEYMKGCSFEYYPIIKESINKPTTVSRTKPDVYNFELRKFKNAIITGAENNSFDGLAFDMKIKPEIFWCVKNKRGMNPSCEKQYYGSLWISIKNLDFFEKVVGNKHGMEHDDDVNKKQKFDLNDEKIVGNKHGMERGDDVNKKQKEEIDIKPDESLNYPNLEPSNFTNFNIEHDLGTTMIKVYKYSYALGGYHDGSYGYQS